MSFLKLQTFQQLYTSTYLPKHHGVMDKSGENLIRSLCFDAADPGSNSASALDRDLIFILFRFPDEAVSNLGQQNERMRHEVKAERGREDVQKQT